MSDINRVTQRNHLKTASTKSMCTSVSWLGWGSISDLLGFVVFIWFEDNVQGKKIGSSTNSKFNKLFGLLCQGHCVYITCTLVFQINESHMTLFLSFCTVYPNLHPKFILKLFWCLEPDTLKSFVPWWQHKHSGAMRRRDFRLEIPYHKLEPTRLWNWNMLPTERETDPWFPIDHFLRDMRVSSGGVCTVFWNWVHSLSIAE